jgi:prefoldin subunit 5
MKVKIKYLEDRITTMEKSIERLHKMLPRLAREFMQEDKQSNDPFIKVMEQGELEQVKDHVSKVKIVGDHELI